MGCASCSQLRPSIPRSGGIGKARASVRIQLTLRHTALGMYPLRMFSVQQVLPDARQCLERAGTYEYIHSIAHLLHSPPPPLTP